ncbi:MAG: MFS transporter [Candidatus Abawacabacteria bacterium]|nr:MFS transporter [Candidatus Abawacabacteria bacterium]
MLLRKLRKAHSLSPKTNQLLSLVSLLVLIEGSLWYLLPNRFEDLLGIELAGVAVAAYGIASVLTNMPMADISDKVSRSFAVYVGIILFTISLLFLHIISFPVAVIIMFLLGIASSCISVGALQLILDHTQNSKSGKATGRYYAFRSIGWSFGGIIGSILMYLFSFTGIAIFLLSLAIFFYFRFLKLLPQRHSLKKVKKSLHILLRDRVYQGEWTQLRKYGLLLATYMAYCLSFGVYEYSIWIAEPIYTANMGTHIILGAVILSALELPRLLFSSRIGALVDKFGGRHFVKIGLLASMAIHIYFIWFSQHTLFDLILMFITMAISDIFLLLAFNQQLHHSVPKNLRAEAFSAGETFYDIGGIVAPLIVGLLLATNMNFSALFSITFLFYGVVCAMILVLLWRDSSLFKLSPIRQEE